jgi:hypothetical protein
MSRVVDWKAEIVEVIDRSGCVSLGRVMGAALGMNDAVL